MIKKTYPQDYLQKLERIGALLREYRLANGYSQKELSENLNLHRNTILRAEKGRNISMLCLIEITQILSIDLYELFSAIEDCNQSS